MQHDSYLHLIGYASGLAGKDSLCGEGPKVMKESHYLPQKSIKWGEIISPSTSSLAGNANLIKTLCEKLAKSVTRQVKAKNRFCVIGGDHTSAIGTWSGVHHALHHEGDIGLIWVDAHMDSHTPETSVTGRIHGMPLAVLLGYGNPMFTEICHAIPKIKPGNLCLIGVRSFEEGEEALLKRLNVRIYFMEEVKERGFSAVFQEAVSYVKAHTIGYGVSLDLDSIDPTEVSAVAVPEPDGIHVNDLYQAITLVSKDPKLIGLEIVEFNPSKDKSHTTEKIVAHVLRLFI